MGEGAEGGARREHKVEDQHTVEESAFEALDTSSERSRKIPNSLGD